MCGLLAAALGCSDSSGKWSSSDTGGKLPPGKDSKVSGKQDRGVKPGTDGPGQKKDKGNPNKALCDCLAKQPRMAFCYKQKNTCAKASDCCYAHGGVACGSYSNKFSCKSGKCVREGCKDAAECRSYAQLVKAKNWADHICHAPMCPTQTSYCAAKVKSCKTPSDCCTGTSSSPCGVYPDHWTCDGGKCKFSGCTSDGECVQMAKSAGQSNASGWRCQGNQSPCYPNNRYCVPPTTKTCQKAGDCCVAGSNIPCGTYGNRYRCAGGICITDYCKDNNDCQAYAAASKLPDPGEYSCIRF